MTLSKIVTNEERFSEIEAQEVQISGSHSRSKTNSEQINTQHIHNRSSGLEQYAGMVKGLNTDTLKA